MDKKDWLVFVLIFLLLGVFIFFLPEMVPIHFASDGKPDLIVNRLWIFLALPIPYSLYWKHFRHK